jgi:hypothetical protein
MNYIIGNNDVSWFLAYLLPETKLILHKTLDKQDYNSGPMIIPPCIVDIVKENFENVTIKDFERFYDDRGNQTSTEPKNFGKLYSLYTRGKTITEDSYNINYSKYVKYVSIDELSPEDSYELLFNKIKETANKRVIDISINSIDLESKTILGDDSIKFDNLISTINIVDLVDLDNSGKIRKYIIQNNNLDGFNLPYNDKFIYTAKLESEEDKILSNLYKQVVVIGKPYFRKTYLKDKILYESMRNIYDKKIEGNSIISYFETTQISDNLNMNKVLGIDLVGKFSEWKDNCTLETIYHTSKQLKEFYNSSENNHKKVL